MTARARQGVVPSAIFLAAEMSSAWTPLARFAVSALSAIEGELPFDRYIMAGLSSACRGASLDAIERSANEWASATFHPVWAHMLGMDDPRAVVERINVYNARDLSDRGFTKARSLESNDPPYWRLSEGPSGEFRLRATRVSPPGRPDPRACQVASLGCIQYAVEHAERRARGACNSRRTLSGIAWSLGVERSVAGEAAVVLEDEGPMPTENLAQRLGCKRRTLERELKAIGLTVGKLRLATMVAAATSRLGSGATLTEIAVDSGFSDLAHMTHVFKFSCGMSPSALRHSRAAGPARDSLSGPIAVRLAPR